MFQARNLLREARRQKHLAEAPVPAICLLDPDGDVVRLLGERGRGEQSGNWACYHTDLLEFTHAGMRMGAVARAVGGAFAVLVAEQLFASGCELLVSVTSAGRLQPGAPEAAFVLIERALRDEGTSYHYLPPAAFACVDPALAEAVGEALGHAGFLLQRAGTWTTDAPFRETESAIARARALGLVGVEMEAAALYAFAAARRCPVVCFAHLTNELAQVAGDFEKGKDEGLNEVLSILGACRAAWARNGRGRAAEEF
ncbi:MAG: nucleoside phosphorylase [Rhodospirillales bacterium]|nr:nucleoside phosphorylase [Rhodospirillales bacterium]